MKNFFLETADLTNLGPHCLSHITINYSEHSYVIAH